MNNVIFLSTIGLFLLFAPKDFQTILPTNYTLLDRHTKKIIGLSFLLFAYYFYNDEKLF